MDFDFLQAMYDCRQLYGITFSNPDDFVEIAMGAWREIGNKRTRSYRYVGQPMGQYNEVELPCNADIIESVTTAPEEWNYVSNKHDGGDINSRIIEEDIENQEKREHMLKPKGHYVHYQKIKNKIFLDQYYPSIEIQYKGVILDDDDLPLLNGKEVKAIATYVAYIKKFKEALMTNNNATAQMSQQLQKSWSLQCLDARTPDEQLSQNEMDEILNAKSRWVNKRYGKSFKPLLH